MFVETVVSPIYQILSTEELIELIGEEHIIPKERFRFQFYVNKILNDKFEDPGYHTAPICQDLSARLLLEIIREKSCLDK